MAEYVKHGEHPAEFADVRDGVFYHAGSLAGIVLHRGRRLDEALRNDPTAPMCLTLPGVQGRGTGKYYTREILAPFVQSYADAGAYAAHLGGSMALVAESAAKVAAKGHKDAIAIRANAREEADQTISQAKADADKIRQGAAQKMRETCQGVYAHLMRQFAKEAPLDCATGVYFLYKKGALQYVGQSVNVYSRIQQHRGMKDFDQAKFIACHRSKLDDMEGFFIRLLEPPLNGGKDPLERSCPKSPTWETMFSLSFVDDEADISTRLMTISNGMMRVSNE